MERKKRYLILELNQSMTDQEEKRFKEWIADGLSDMKRASNNAVLTIPKLALRTEFKNDSDIVMIHNKIIS